MINEEILGGLKSALERGEPLKKAMITMLNSGYQREEIEEAARAMNGVNIQPQPQLLIKQPAPVVSALVKQLNPIVSSPIKQIPATPQINQQPMQIPQQYIPQQQYQPVQIIQKVSEYGNSNKDKAMIYILMGVLIFLFGLLLTIFIFKQDLINFFSSMFG
ncbi:Uncharacterised protein [uncultured archaeon]|nr:Uncharacterised protein [uncultured archaeon]